MERIQELFVQLSQAIGSIGETHSYGIGYSKGVLTITIFDAVDAEKQLELITGNPEINWVFTRDDEVFKISPN